MEFQIEYTKNKGEVFKTLDKYNIIHNNQIQNYIPLYDFFFKLNDTNYNHINLNTNYIIESFDKRIAHNMFQGSLQNVKNSQIENIGDDKNEKSSLPNDENIPTNDLDDEIPF